MYLQSEKLYKAIKDDKIIIRPLLEEDQIQQVSVDFRLGYDFLVSIQGREPFMDTSLINPKRKPINTFFQPTRRRIGESFILHPNQTVLANSLEYIKLPNNIFGTLSMRSSYSRLGITISTFIQPGYCGCISLELTNLNKNSINLTVGAKIFQGRFVQLEGESNYFNSKRKYLCQVRPKSSAVYDDEDLETLKMLWEESNDF